LIYFIVLTFVGNLHRQQLRWIH